MSAPAPEPAPRVVLVTGVSSGIGRALVLEGLGRGLLVSGCARRAERLEELRRAAGAPPSRLHLAAADVTSKDQTDGWIGGALGAFGRIDAVVHNAGYGCGGPIEELTVEDFREQFETNFFAVVRLTRELIPHLVRQGGGDVVMISSVLGLMALPGRAPYCSSKWALEGYAEAIRGELRRHRIRVSVVNPGMTASEFPAAMKVRGTAPPPALARKMSAETVARAALDCLGKTRRNLPLTGLGRLAVWLHRFAPGLIDRVGERSFRRAIERR